MKVILQQDVPGLGEEGDVCEVATGYARNFLFRTQAALPFTTHAMTLLEHRREGIERRKEEKRAGAAGLRERLENEELTFQMPDHSLKMIGDHTVRVRLYENQSANVKVVIEADQD